MSDHSGVRMARLFTHMIVHYPEQKLKEAGRIFIRIVIQRVTAIQRFTQPNIQAPIGLSAAKQQSVFSNRNTHALEPA